MYFTSDLYFGVIYTGSYYVFNCSYKVVVLVTKFRQELVSMEHNLRLWLNISVYMVRLAGAIT